MLRGVAEVDMLARTAPLNASLSSTHQPPSREYGAWSSNTWPRIFEVPLVIWEFTQPVVPPVVPPVSPPVVPPVVPPVSPPVVPPVPPPPPVGVGGGHLLMSVALGCRE